MLMTQGQTYNSTYNRGRRTKGDLLGRTNPVQSKFIDRNTVEWTAPDGTVSIRLHDTDIIVQRKNRIAFDTNGWKTVTTKDRLNKFAPAGFSFWSHKGQWTASTPAGQFPFVDGAEFYLSSGRPCKPSLHNDESAKVKAEKKLIAAYAAKMRKGFSLESGGDPWILPDKTTGLYEREYILGWLKEKYVFPTLIWHALKAAGMRDQGASYYMQTDSKGVTGNNMTAQRVRRYLAKCLGHAV